LSQGVARKEKSQEKSQEKKEEKKEEKKRRKKRRKGEKRKENQRMIIRGHDELNGWAFRQNSQLPLPA